MATINIRRDVTDPFYRYKMERLQSKIEGKGNGIKSVIVNLSSVAHSLSRDPACKFYHQIRSIYRCLFIRGNGSSAVY